MSTDITDNEIDILQELSDRHDEVMERLDELERQIDLVMNECIQRANSRAEKWQQELDVLAANETPQPSKEPEGLHLYVEPE